jgi:acetylornithine deacetylase/succinyl-diaminopimelate desuccinylase-like protein
MEGKSVDLTALSTFCEGQYDTSVIPSLMTYMGFQNQSRAYDELWETNGLLDQAANHIKLWVEGFGIKGLKTEVIKEKGLSPIVFTEIPGDLPQTIFYYGHFDKQPPFEGWRVGLGPYTPVIVDGKLYGRGGADDGYSTYSTMVSIKACQEQGIKLPRCVMITEGDEESGSDHMVEYVKMLKDRIGTPDMIFCLDSGALDYESFCLTTSLRGVINAIYTIDILNEGVHSGVASGIVPSSFRIMRQMLDRIENGPTGEMIPELQSDIPPERYQEIYEVVQALGTDAIPYFPFVEGATTTSQNPLTVLINNWWKAQLSTIGAADLPPASTAGSVLRPRTTLALSIRIPPNKSNE